MSLTDEIGRGAADWRIWMASPGDGSADHTWTIAELSEEFGVTHRAIRFYEDRGLITPQRRGTQRIFHARDRVRLELVLRGKRLGFGLEEIRRIIDMYDSAPGEAGQLRYLLDQITVRRAELEQIIGGLRHGFF